MAIVRWGSRGIFGEAGPRRASARVQPGYSDERWASRGSRPCRWWQDGLLDRRRAGQLLHKRGRLQPQPIAINERFSEQAASGRGTAAGG